MKQCEICCELGNPTEALTSRLGKPLCPEHAHLFDDVDRSQRFGVGKRLWENRERRDEEEERDTP